MLNNKRKNYRKYLIFLFFILAVFTVGFIIIKYNVEGEKNIPFNITKLLVVSSAQTEELEKNDNLYQANIIQNNDIYLAIEKNENYKKTDAIKKITINNFNTIEKGKNGELKIYRIPIEEKNYVYSSDYEINNYIEFFGDLNTNLKMKKMTISNQGGLIEFSIVLNNLGKITYGENENIQSDGTLLKRLNLTTEDVKTVLQFDMIIELSSGKTFKTTIDLDLPIGDIAEQGVCSSENTKLDKLVFKRL